LVRVVHTPACYISYSTAEDSPSRPLREPPIYQHASLIPMKHVPAHPEGFPSMPTLAGARVRPAPARAVRGLCKATSTGEQPWTNPSRRRAHPAQACAACGSRSAGCPSALAPAAQRWLGACCPPAEQTQSLTLIPPLRHVCSILANEHGHQPHRTAQT